MLNTQSLVGMYREEKAAQFVLGGTFPSFKDWKAEYMSVWNVSHAGSSFLPFDLAVEITEGEIEALPAG